jgi:hypothetical protein
LRWAIRAVTIASAVIDCTLGLVTVGSPSLCLTVSRQPHLPPSISTGGLATANAAIRSLQAALSACGRFRIAGPANSSRPSRSDANSAQGTPSESRSVPRRMNSLSTLFLVLSHDRDRPLR